MSLNPNVIISKVEKFRRIYDDISKFSKVQSYFIGVYPNLYHHFSENQKEIFENLGNVYYERKEKNDPFYDLQIDYAITFLKEILDMVEKPITFSNGCQMETFEKRYSFIHNPEHDGSHLGSDFSVISPNGEVIKKIKQIGYNHIHGKVKSFYVEEYEPEQWLMEMGKGLYAIGDFRFDLGRFTSFGYDYFTKITIYFDEEENHPIIKYLKKTGNTVEYDDVSCTSCGDGGCFHCEPQHFI